MKRTVTLILVLVLMGGAGSARIALAQDSATPEIDTGVNFALLTMEQVPEGMVIISDGDRMLDDVASGFGDPVGTIEQFVTWGWEGNAIRAFHIADGEDAPPETVDGIYISVHQFGSPTVAAEALEYSVEEHLLDPVIEEVTSPAFGERSRALMGEMAYGTEITFYVQAGPYLIRLSASSPEGDPTVEATGLMQSMLNAQPATPAAT